MRGFVGTAKPLLKAFFTTVLAVLAFAALRGLGVAPDLSILAGLILAGSLNIHGLASLNDEQFLPTSRQALGEH